MQTSSIKLLHQRSVASIVSELGVGRWEILLDQIFRETVLKDPLKSSSLQKSALEIYLEK